MPKRPNQGPPQVTVQGQYWTFRFRQGKAQRTWTFGKVSEVPKALADVELSRRLANQSSGAARGTNSNSTYLSLDELCQKFLDMAVVSYVREDGSQTGEATNLRFGLQPLIALFGGEPAVFLRPIHIRTFCDAQVRAKVSRVTINKRIQHIKRMLLWGKNEEILPPAKSDRDAFPVCAYDACRDFQLLRRGRPAISGGTVPREVSPIGTVSEETVAQTMAQLPQIVQDMIQLQQLTSMRPAEVCGLKLSEIDISRSPWLYEPVQHKTKHRGKPRRIYIGPKGRELLKTYLLRPRTEPMFRPADAKAQKELDVRTKARKFSTRTYRDSIWRACDRAFQPPDEIKGAAVKLHRFKLKQKKSSTPETVPAALVKMAKLERKWKTEHRWSPNQLRHNGLTEIVDRELAKATERAQVVAGHSNKRTTAIYLDTKDELAATVMEQAG